MDRPFRFNPPDPGAAAVLRPRLLEPLARRFELRLVTVEADAGFGKTTLLSQAVAENRLAPRGRDAWLTCEPADSSPSVLLGGVLRAVGGREPEVPPTVHDVCETIWSAAPEQVCVVLDDAQHIEPGSAGEEALGQLLAGLPENGHLVVAARRLPGFARSRLVVQRRAVELTHAQLAFDEHENDALAANHGASRDVVRKAGGWPALAELQASLGSADARRFVWEEVIEPLDDAHRGAFLFLVAVGGADAEALAAATGQPIDGDRLAALPLVAVDGRGGLRPHPLWEELLADRIDPGFADDARRALAEILTARGQHGDAFELLAASGAWDRGLEVLFEACNDLDHPPWPDQMARWAHLVPPELAGRPEVAHLRGTIARAGDPWSDVAKEAFAAAIDGFHARGDAYREILAGVRASQVAWLHGDREGVAATHRRGTQLLDEGWPIEPLLALSRASMADIDGRADDVLEATTALEDVDARLRHFAPLLRVFAHLAAGDPGRAVEDAAEAAAAVAGDSPVHGPGFESSCLPAMVAWGCGRLDAAAAQPLDDPGPRESLAQRVPTIALGAVVAAHVGDVARARTLLDKLETLVPDIGNRDLLAGYRAVAGAALAVATGDEAAAAAELAEHLDGRPLEPVTAGRAILWLPSLPYLFYEPARRLLDEIPSGPGREQALALCRALLASRQGLPWSPPGGLDQPDVLLTVLPAPLAAELVVRASAVHGATSGATIAALARRAPEAVRRTLRALAGGDDPAAPAARSLLGGVPIPPRHSVRVEVLGPARLLIDGAPVDDPKWRRQRVRHLMCALVAHRAVRRARLGALLWPDFDESAVSANLRLTLSYVQSLLEPGRSRGDAPWFLQQDGGVLRLQGGDRFGVDAWELESHLDAAAAAAAAGTPSVELAHLLGALGLWSGEYLDDVAGEEWAEPLRERMHSRFVSAAVRAGELLVAAGRPEEALRAADAALAVDRWSEAAHLVLANAHAALGDADAARRARESAERRLAELGIEVTRSEG